MPYVEKNKAMNLPELTVIYEPYPLTPEFREDWEKLYPRAPGANVFTTLFWLEEGWRHFAPKNREAIRPVRFVNNSGETVAMCVHKETTVPRSLGLLSSWHTLEYNSQRIVPVLAIDLPHIVGAVVALYNDLARRMYVFDFFKLDPLDGRLQQINDELAERGFEPELSVFTEQPQLRLPESWDEYHHSHGRTFWKNPRRMRNKMGKEIGEVRFKRLREPQDFASADLDAVIDDVFEVFDKSWQKEEIISEGVITPQQLKDFYRTIAPVAVEKGLLDLNVLYAGDRPVAYDLNFVEGETVYMIFGAFDAEVKRYSPGKILFIHWLEDSHARGDRVFEFGGMFLGYKEKWTEIKVPCCRLRLRGKTLLARLRSAIKHR